MIVPGEFKLCGCTECMRANLNGQISEGCCLESAKFDLQIGILDVGGPFFKNNQIVQVGVPFTLDLRGPRLS